MTENTANLVEFPIESTRNVLEEILRDGARKMLSQAIQEEVAMYLEAPSSLYVANPTTRETTLNDGVGNESPDISNHVLYIRYFKAIGISMGGRIADSCKSCDPFLN